MMQQPTPGGLPPTMVPPMQVAQQQYSYTQAPPPQAQQPYMMMGQAPPMWGQQSPSMNQTPPMWGQQSPSMNQTPPQQAPTSADEVRTLWIGDLQYWMDENYIASCFPLPGQIVTVKVIRNKQTHQIEGYGFIEFVSRAFAENVLQMYNGTQMPHGEQKFRLNWASFGASETPDYTVFVGDLAPDVTDYVLQQTFQSRYNSVKGAKVVMDRLTGRSKGYGFVRFGDEAEQNRAMTEMDGFMCSTRPMRVGAATNKKSSTGQQYGNAPSQGTQDENDASNTTVFIGNLDSSLTEDYLRDVFSHYGHLIHVKIPPNKRCGFVQFGDRGSAEKAMQALNGTMLGGQSVRLAWGRNSPNKQQQADPNQWNNGYYGYAQGYDYSYPAAAAAAAPQDPNMYYGGYAGYGNYQQQPQQQQQQQQQQQVGYS